MKKGESSRKKNDKITYELILRYLKQRGYRDNVDGTKKYAYWIYTYYQENVVKGKKADLREISEIVAKKFKCTPGSIEQATRYITITRYPDKNRAEVLDYFIEELQKITDDGSLGALEGSKIEYLISDKAKSDTMRFLLQNDFDLTKSLDIFIERPETANGDSPFYDIGIMDAKQSRCVLRSSSALTVGELARNQRLADIYYCFDIVKYIYREVRTGNNAVQIKVYADEIDFFQGESISMLAVE